jgi:hypothetical protein
MLPVSWRPATRADLPRIEELWDEQEKRFADTPIAVDRPQLFQPEENQGHAFYPFQPPVLNVAVAEKDGQIVGFRYTEAVPEVCIVTGDQDVMGSIGDELTREGHKFKQLGFRSGWGLIPKKFIGAFRHFIKRYPHIRPWPELTPVGIIFRELGD